MFKRLALIRDAGGTNTYIRTWIVLLGTVILSAGEWLFFGSVIGGCAAIVLTIAGWCFRASIMEMGAVYGKHSMLILFVYGFILFLTKRLGFGQHAQVVVITIATAFMFNLNFWSISEAALWDETHFDESDPVVNLADSAVRTFNEYLAGSPNSYIRLSVTGEGVAGYLYDLKIQDLPVDDNDRVDTSHGFILAVASQDAPMLQGSTISWETQADGTQGFKFDNPNAF